MRCSVASAVARHHHQKKKRKNKIKIHHGLECEKCEVWKKKHLMSALYACSISYSNTSSSSPTLPSSSCTESYMLLQVKEMSRKKKYSEAGKKSRLMQKNKNFSFSMGDAIWWGYDGMRGGMNSTEKKSSENWCPRSYKKKNRNIDDIFLVLLESLRLRMSLRSWRVRGWCECCLGWHSIQQRGKKKLRRFFFFISHLARFLFCMSTNQSTLPWT